MEIAVKDKKELRILCIYAYCGDFLACDTNDVEAIFERLGETLDRGAYMECCALRQKEFLQRNTEVNGVARFFIIEEYELPLLELLYKDASMADLLKILEMAKFRIDPRRAENKTFREWLLRVCDIRPDGQVWKPRAFSWRQTKIMAGAMEHPLWAPAIKAMDFDTFASCMEDFIHDAFAQGRQLNWKQLWENYGQGRQEDKSPIYPSHAYGHYGLYFLPEYMGLYCFLMTGVQRLPHPRDNQWGLLYKACIELYNGQYAEAVKDFAASLKMYDGYQHTDRQMFDSFAFNYLYVMALMLDNTKESRETLCQLTENSGMRFDMFYRWTLISLVKYAMYGSKFETNEYVKVAHQLDAVSASLTNTIIRFGTSYKSDFTFLFDKPEYALTSWEADCNVSLINRLHVREPWEIAMDELTTQTVGEAPSDNLQRIIYLVEENGDIVPSIQKQNAKGAWGAGLRKLWGRGKKHDIPEYADDEDRKILSHLAENETRFSGAGSFLLLSGNQKLFRREVVQDEGMQKVNIKIEKPYMIVDELSDGSFSFTSNITLGNLETEDTVCVRRQDENNYEVMQMQSWEKTAFQILLRAGHMPASAKPRLVQMLQLLKDRTDIHSSMIEEELPTQEGDSRLVVRIYPHQHNSNLWGIQMKVIPFLLNGYTEKVGEGRSLYVVTNQEGCRGQLRRDFEKEVGNRNLFLEFLAGLIGMEKTEEDGMLDYQAVVDESVQSQLGLEELLQVVEWIQAHPENAVLEMMDGSKFRVSGVAKLKSISIASARKNNWLSMVGQVEIDATKMESLSDFINRLDQGVGDYIRLDEQTFCKISKELQQKVRLLKSVLQRQEDELLVNKLAFAALDGAFGDQLVTADFSVKQLRHNIRNSVETPVAVSPELQGTLKPYQQEGYEWMARLSAWSGGACLADDMGLGKTIQTIALMLHRKEEGPSLVVAPTSVVANWRKEITRFAPTLSVQVLNEPCDHISVIHEAGTGSVVVASYGLLVSMQQDLEAKRWNIACLDEAHVIKNHLTKTFRAAASLHAASRIILTGTPVQNNLMELWSLFQFITPGLLGGFKGFKKKYAEGIEEYDEKDDQLEGLRHVVAPFLLRRTKEQVLDDLPEIDDSVRYIQLSDEEMAIYESTRKKTADNLNLFFNNFSKNTNSAVCALAMLTTLREIPCSCSLVVQGWKQRSSKEQALLDLLEEIDLGHYGVLVFSQFTSFLTEVRHLLEEEGIAYLYLDGATSQQRRQQLIDQYQSGESPAVFLISLKAGGVGLNLTRANYVIHLDPWWNPSIEQQATDRVYRIGQDKNVTVYHLIASHTIEERILELHQHKQHISDGIMAGASFNATLSPESILRLLER